MNTISGYVYDKNKKTVSNAKVALLNGKFEVEFAAETDDTGFFCLQADSKVYPYFIAVKEYKTNYFEYWSYNVRLDKDLVLNPKIDRLEILSLIFFPSLDADNTMMIYFRPASLTLFMTGNQGIVPEIDSENVTVSINGEFCEILTLREIREIQEKGVEPIKAYAIKTAPQDLQFNGKNMLEISITDKNGDYGEATLFF